MTPHNPQHYMHLVEMVKSRIPKEEWSEVMSQAYCEYEYTTNDAFLGFLETYEDAKKNIPREGMTVVDMGCYLGAQAYMFDKYRYVGVDVVENYDSKVPLRRFTPPWATHYSMSAQEYINKYMSDKKKNVFAVASYMPDDEAMDLIEERFDNCYIYYPGGRRIIKVNGEYVTNQRMDK